MAITSPSDASVCTAFLSTATQHLGWTLEPLVASFAFLFFMRLFRQGEARAASIFKPPFHFTRRGIGALVVYWLGVAIWVGIVPRVAGASDGCPRDLSKFVYLVAEVSSGIVAYDFLFFWVHVLMHTSKTVSWLTSHQQHHRYADEETAYRTVNHSMVDGALQVLVNILVQRHTPWGTAKSQLARLLHNVIVIELLVESHSSSARLQLARRLFHGVARHCEHHRNGGGAPYAQFFGYFDAWLVRWQQRPRRSGTRCTRSFRPVGTKDRTEPYPVGQTSSSRATRTTVQREATRLNAVKASARTAVES